MSNVDDITVTNFSLQLADVAMINASTTLFVAVHARIFLKEPIQAINLLNIFMVLIGLGLIVGQPFSDTKRSGTVSTHHRKNLNSVKFHILDQLFETEYRHLIFRMRRTLPSKV